MAKRKHNQQPGGDQGVNPETYPSVVEDKAMGDESIDSAGVHEPEVSKDPSATSRILTEEDARALVQEKYTVPSGCKLILVTEDKNVFFENHSSAINHAVRHNLKIFRLQWD